MMRRAMSRRTWVRGLLAVTCVVGAPLLGSGCGEKSPNDLSFGGAGGEGGDAGCPGSGGCTGSGAFDPSIFLFGADLSSIPEQIDAGSTFVDVDGTPRPVLEILAAHGFNSVRLRTFVEPSAPYGYAVGDGSAECRKGEPYCDLAHTLEFARAIKAAGLGFVLDFHYSDNWADPGKQLIPAAWRSARDIDELAAFVDEYTYSSIAALVEGGARPDVVQIGNEITPGMLMHVPTGNTDCWGNGVATNGVSGSAANWTNLGALLRAGVAAVKRVDPTIRVLLHIENTEDTAGAVAWVGNALEAGVDFDILGLSCYPNYQGPPEGWRATFEALAERYPELEFVVAEYGPQATDVVAVLRDLPNDRGVGAFLWEPTLSGAWGPGGFVNEGGTLRANPELFEEYSRLSTELGL